MVALQVVQQCMRILSDRRSQHLNASAGGSAAQDKSARESRPAGGTISSLDSFVGEVLARLCRRGHAPLVAAALWSVIPRSGSGPFPRPSADGHVHASFDMTQARIGGESLAAADADMSARRHSHAAASSSKSPAEAKMARASRCKASSASKFAFPDPRTCQQQSSPSQQERGAQPQMSEKLEATSQQQEGTQNEKAELSKVLLEACAAVRLAMQTVEDATALERLLEAVLREAARDLDAVGPHEGALGQAAENLVTILDGPLLTRPEIRFISLIETKQEALQTRGLEDLLLNSLCSYSLGILQLLPVARRLHLQQLLVVSLQHAHGATQASHNDSVHQLYRGLQTDAKEQSPACVEQVLSGGQGAAAQDSAARPDAPAGPLAGLVVCTTTGILSPWLVSNSSAASCCQARSGDALCWHMPVLLMSIWHLARLATGGLCSLSHLCKAQVPRHASAIC